jgi:hypothetical protein
LGVGDHLLSDDGAVEGVGDARVVGRGHALDSNRFKRVAACCCWRTYT